MEDILYISSLYDIYMELLTLKQRDTFEDYYFENLTIEEIANQRNVSKNAISKQLKTVKNELLSYEKKLKIYEKKINIISILKDNKELLDKILKII